MSILHNRISNKELKERMIRDNGSRITLSFYKYFNIEDTKAFRDLLWTGLTNLKVFGRIYIANEGINAQISVPTPLYESMRNYIYSLDKCLYKVHMNCSLEENTKAFWVLRVKIRANIVADGISDKNFNFDYNHVGTYIKAHTVNAMFKDPNVLFVDMRNSYEYEIGHFTNALKISANTFRDQLAVLINKLKEYKNKKIVLYCTGGIRCEKATAWMIYNGFKKVYHIEGGIIEYVRCAREHKLPVYFHGKMFVFDERMSERISDEIISNCYQCYCICDRQVNCINNKCHVLFIQCNKCAETYNNCCSKLCKENLYKYKFV
ncbi:oxygen-dependent tRNA uridine(34) hydroxylase TrhO [Candidatus Ishikawella capsulata]|nr:rhodanese-related sulfurtransferase [Candidatus Ishikawaella capsulata]